MMKNYDDDYEPEYDDVYVEHTVNRYGDEELVIYGLFFEDDEETVKSRHEISSWVFAREYLDG